MWAFGITSYELWSDGLKPFKKFHRREVKKIVIEGADLSHGSICHAQDLKRHGCPQKVMQCCQCMLINIRR